MNESCELPVANPSPQEIREILKTARRIAVVGHSNDPRRDSHRVARYLATHGYEVFAVNPSGRSTPEIKFYPDLASVPGPIDVVEIFRRKEAIPDIVDEAIKKGAKVVWMQLGLVDNPSARKARAAGLKVVMDRCMLVEHRALTAAAAS